MPEDTTGQTVENFISFGASPPPGKTPAPSTPATASTTAEDSRKGKRKASDTTPGPSEEQSKKKSKDKKKKKGKSLGLPQDPNPYLDENGQPLTKRQKKDQRAQERQKQKEREAAKKAAKNKPANNSRRPGGSAAGSETGPKNKKEEKKAAERHAPWTELVDLDRCQDPTDLLTEEVTAFYKYASPTKAEFEVRLFMIELISRAVNRLWPDAEVFPFGSWLTQLYLPQGDIDLVISHKGLSEGNKARLLADLGKAMRQAGITDTVVIIAKARVPIIKFVTLEGKINVDISLNTINGVTAGKIITQYLDSLPGSRQMILVVKSFLSQRSMNEVYTGGLGSYAVICLVISFLQQHPKLRRSEINPEANLGTLLLEFFELYGRNFNYNDVGLSIRRGGSYYSKAARGWMNRQNFLLSIEDPQDKDNDISSGSFGIRQVRNTLQGAYELLSLRLFERAAQMSVSRTAIHSMDGDDWSILGGVMGITKETLKQRAELKRIHEERRLHKKLDIPVGGDPAKYVKNYKPPPVTNVPSMYGRYESPPPSPDGAGSSKGREDVNAIMVEDDELSSGSESASASDDSSDVTHSKHKPLGDSEPSEDEFEIIEEPEEDSRYAISKRPKPKGTLEGNGKTPKADAFSNPVILMPEEEDSDEEALRKIMEDSEYELEDDGLGKEVSQAIEVVDSSDSSDDAAINGAGGNMTKKRREKAPRKATKAQKKLDRKRAFWAAKAGNRLGNTGGGGGEQSD